jgi:hypothetical protein
MGLLCCCPTQRIPGIIVGDLDLGAIESQIPGINLASAAVSQRESPASLLPPEAATFQTINADSSSSDLDMKRLDRLMKTDSEDDADPGVGDPADGSSGADSDAI